jgi:hypothetical protein
MKLVIIITAYFSLISCSYKNTKPRPAIGDDTSGPTVVTFGDRATLQGTLQQIKTYGDNGAVFPFYLKMPKGVIVRPDDNYDPGDTNQELDGMEVIMLEAVDIYETECLLNQYKDKEVIVEGHVSGGSSLYCFNFGLFVDSTRSIRLEH